MASTLCPTQSSAEEASSIGAGRSAAWMRRTARSFSASNPTTSASYASEPPCRDTLTFLGAAPLPATTWKFVLSRDGC